MFIHSLMKLQDWKVSLIEKYQWDYYFEWMAVVYLHVHFWLFLAFFSSGPKPSDTKVFNAFSWNRRTNSFIWNQIKTIILQADFLISGWGFRTQCLYVQCFPDRVVKYKVSILLRILIHGLEFISCIWLKCFNVYVVKMF